MADFKIRNLAAQTVQNADYIHNESHAVHNEGPVVGQLEVSPKVKMQLQSLLADIAAFTRSGAISQEAGYELRDFILTAANEADAPAPRARRLTAMLSRAKEVAAGLTATVGIAEAVDGIIKALGGGT